MILPSQPKPAKSSFPLDVLARLPLAEAFSSLWHYRTRHDILQLLYQQHRGNGYQQQLSFSQLVTIVADALTRHRRSGPKAIQDALNHQQLPTQQRAVYGKLSRIPLPLAEALLPELPAQLRLLLPASAVHTALPPSFNGLTVVVLDGKKIKRVAAGAYGWGCRGSNVS